MFQPYVSHRQKSISFSDILGKQKSIKVIVLAAEHLQGTDGNCFLSPTIAGDLLTIICYQPQRGPALELVFSSKNGKPAEVKESQLNISDYVNSSTYRRRVFRW